MNPAITELRQEAHQAVERAKKLRAEAVEADRIASDTYHELLAAVRAERGSAADMRRATIGIDWDFDAMRAVRREV